MTPFSELCKLLQVPLIGEDRPVEGIADPQTAEKHHVVVLSSKDMLNACDRIQSKCCIISSRLATPEVLQSLQAARISVGVVNNTGKALAMLVNHFHSTPVASGVHSSALIHPNAVVDPSAIVSALCFVGPGCSIGPGSVLHPRVTLVQDVVLGARVILHSGSVLGSDGFGFYEEDGELRSIPHIGKLRIGDDVWIGANCTIARGTLRDTRIGNGCKIDNLVQIAHNVHIGEHTAIAAQAGISGSTTIGSYVRIGGQAGLVGHIRIGDRVTIGAQAGVIADVPPGRFVAGYPAEERIESLRKEVYIKKIPMILNEIKKLKKR